MEQDPTLYYGTYDTTGVNPGDHADVTKVTDTNFKEPGRNPAGIADWEQKFELVLEHRRQIAREAQAAAHQTADTTEVGEK